MIYDEDTQYMRDGNRKHKLKEFEVKKRKDGKGAIRTELLFPKEYIGKKIKIKIFISKEKITRNKAVYPKGCYQCPNRFDCRFIKLNDVSRCKKNRENLRKYGYKKRGEE